MWNYQTDTFYCIVIILIIIWLYMFIYNNFIYESPGYRNKAHKEGYAVKCNKFSGCNIKNILECNEHIPDGYIYKPENWHVSKNNVLCKYIKKT